MTEPTLYLFDGYNLLHAGSFHDREQLVDRLADFVAMKGARGVVVFDGRGDERDVGRLEVRYAPTPTPCSSASPRNIASSSASVWCRPTPPFGALRGRRCRSDRREASSADFEPAHHEETTASRVGDRIDEDTRAALERLRRGEGEQDDP